MDLETARKNLVCVAVLLVEKKEEGTCEMEDCNLWITNVHRLYLRYPSGEVKCMASVSLPGDFPANICHECCGELIKKLKDSGFVHIAHLELDGSFAETHGVFSEVAKGE